MTNGLSATPGEPAADDSLNSPRAPGLPVFDEERVSFAASSPPRPVVVVKRRRLSLNAAPGADGDQSADAAESSVKAPKVFRMTTPTTVSGAPQQQAVSPESAANAAPAPLRRRRHDALRAPLLVSHVVFEQPDRQPEIASFVAVEPAHQDTEGDYRAVMDALTRVRKELEVARSARLFRL